MEEKIKSIFEECTGMDLSPDSRESLVKSGYLDSFSMLMLISNLEAEFKIKFTFDDALIDNLNSINAIVKLVKGKGAGS